MTEDWLDYPADQREPLGIAGCFVLRHAVSRDDRGAFHRVLDENLMDAGSSRLRRLQWSVSHNTHRGTLRGPHFQLPPYEETKIVACVSGRVLDVLVDLRSDQPTLGFARAFELEANDGKSVVVAPGVAHGFLTLEDDSSLIYGIHPAYQPTSTSGVRWADPALGIDWTIPPVVVSDRDRHLPSLAEAIALR
ncbi:MAG: dTDP-4-dehydrorhamnose 3,5-epimerase family protein, partial [Alphaproteobacteria bacterium]|nr:dTDP-4-dehydrorhamnose 3,5-epimerase family protein [Alphaproteobacteria bacterium]